jgi:hypothetical protein
MFRLIKCWRIKAEFGKTLLLLLSICVVSLPISFFKGNYYPHYVKYNNPFISNQFPPWRITAIPQRPNFLENTTTDYVGLRSIFDGYFKFRFVDMMVYPYLTRNYELTQEHRTSFWSRLYGSLNSISFDGWPRAWAIHSEWIYWLRRFIFIFALIPSGLLILGIIKSFKSCKQLLTASYLKPEIEEDALLLCIFIFSIVFAAYNFYLWRSFDMAKGLYILSSMLPLAGLVVRGSKIISVICRESILNTISFLLLFLALCYILDLSFLYVYLQTATERIPN